MWPSGLFNMPLRESVDTATVGLLPGRLRIKYVNDTYQGDAASINGGLGEKDNFGNAGHLVNLI
jgi:hypothetical protein